MRMPIGSRVELVRRSMVGRLQPGDTGTIVGYYSAAICCVEWDENIHGHDCGGLAKSGHGWNVFDREIRETFCEDDADVAIDLSGLL